MTSKLIQSVILLLFAALIVLPPNKHFKWKIFAYRQELPESYYLGDALNKSKKNILNRKSSKCGLSCVFGGGESNIDIFVFIYEENYKQVFLHYI